MEEKKALNLGLSGRDQIVRVTQALNGARHAIPDTLVEDIRELKQGDKLSVKRAERLGLDTQHLIPVDGIGLVTARLRVAGSATAWVEIEATDTQYQLTLQHGAEGRTGAEVRAGKKLKQFAAAYVTAGGEVAAGATEGTMIGFPMTDAGRESLIAFIGKLTRVSEKLEPKDWIDGASRVMWAGELSGRMQVGGAAAPGWACCRSSAIAAASVSVGLLMRRQQPL